MSKAMETACFNIIRLHSVSISLHNPIKWNEKGFLYDKYLSNIMNRERKRVIRSYCTAKRK